MNGRLKFAAAMAVVVAADEAVVGAVAGALAA